MFTFRLPVNLRISRSYFFVPDVSMMLPAMSTWTPVGVSPLELSPRQHEKRTPIKMPTTDNLDSTTPKSKKNVSQTKNM